MSIITMEGINDNQQSRIILNAQIYFIKKMMEVTKEQQTVIRESLQNQSNESGNTFTKVL
ncbi:MAG: hypothetical protein KBG82_07265 [Spirochaetes bacterium]|jgi:ribosomal protein S13|nr:hypothetical protein [Spirochaetota bacterium]NLJ04312.1 hypothetical protein [Exilispira sp.]MBP8991760.1 hypothetical protein [Spirochaetota bacterium]HNV43838.1 hypothetical protein [Exilispira sp.]HOV45889.1 hypothetical protein [Exilispira sp.]